MQGQWLRTALAVSSVLLVSSVPMLAQSQFASFTGTVTSSDGNPLPNVELVATNEATQVTYTARSNDAGLYTISALPIGTYKVKAEASNFRALRDQPDQARIGPERARGHHAGGRGHRAGRSHRRQPDPPDRGRRRRRGHLRDDHRADAAQRAQLLAAIAAAARGDDDGAGHVHGAQELRPRTALRQRPARAGEQLHARRRRHERSHRQPAAVPAQPGCVGGGPRRHEQLLGRVRQRCGRGCQQHDQVGHERVPRQRLRVLARQQHGRQLVGQQPGRRQKNRPLSAYFRRHHRRPHRPEQDLLFRRLPGFPPRSPRRAGSERGARGMACGAISRASA